MVTFRPRRLGRFRNVVATNTATPALSLRGKTAAATIVVVRRPRPQLHGLSGGEPAKRGH